MIWLAFLFAGVGAGWMLGEGSIAQNLDTIGTWGPRGMLIAVQGITLGLCARDRVRLGSAFASPTLAFLGKRVLLGAAVVTVTFALAPVDWPAGWLDAFAGAHALGWAVWLANLPPRL